MFLVSKKIYDVQRAQDMQAVFESKSNEKEKGKYGGQPVFSILPFIILFHSFCVQNSKNVSFAEREKYKNGLKANLTWTYEVFGSAPTE